LLVVLFFGISVLTTTQNKGSAFIAPLTPLALVVAVYFIYKLSPNRLANAFTIAIGSAICIIAAAPLASTSSTLAYPRELRLPILGWWAKITDGRSTIQLYEQAMLDAGNDSQVHVAFSPSEPISPTQKKAYASLIDSMSSELQSDSLGKDGIAFGFRHYLLNVNSIRLSGMLNGGARLTLMQVEPVVTGDTVEGYYLWLMQGEASHACLLLTMSGNGGQFSPIVTKSFLLQAAQKAGFSHKKIWLTPSGQKLGLWQRTQGPRPCNIPIS